MTDSEKLAIIGRIISDTYGMNNEENGEFYVGIVSAIDSILTYQGGEEK
jgi:hypothetical protein